MQAATAPDYQFPVQASNATSLRNKQAIPLFVMAGGLLVMILSASWAPDSRMTELRWVPKWLAALADQDPNIRTAVPFIPLAFLLVVGFTVKECRWPLVWTLSVCGVCLGLSELGQVLLPGRTADGCDLLWGGVGIAVGTGLALLCRRFFPQSHAAEPERPETAAVRGNGGARASHK